MEGDDRISNLPLFILHDILARLDRSQQLCVLSKQWKSTLAYFPFLQFNLNRGDDVDDFAKLVDNSLDRFLGSDLLIKNFYLRCICLDRDWASQHVDRWIESVLYTGTSILSLTVSTKTTIGEDFPVEHYILPKTTFVPRFTGSGCSKLHFLEKLSLSSICISESIIQDIIRNCPNLQYLSLWQFSGLKTLRIFNLEKLTSLCVVVDNDARELESVLVDAPNLDEFRFSSFEQDLPVKIGFVSSPHLRTTLFEQCAFRDDEFNSLLLSCPNIESMEIEGCCNLQKFVISSQRLSSLCLIKCHGIEIIDIDAPNLSSFTYETHVMPLIFTKKVTCPISLSYSLVKNELGELANSWFLKLRELLDASTQIQELKLIVYDSEVKFNLDDFEEDAIPPKIEVGHLKLTSCGIRTPMNHSTFIDALLWTCHPKRISMKCESNFVKDLIKDLCAKLLDKKPVCCSDYRVKCWRHDLMTAKIERFGSLEDEEQLLNWRSLSHALPSLTRYDQVSFNLEWRFC